MEFGTQRKITMPKSKLYVKLDYVIWKNSKGQHHREDGPALVYASGTAYWYLNDKCHREDGLAILEASGTKY